MTFKTISKLIGKSQTTVSREVKLHPKTHTNSFVKSDEVCQKLLKAPFVCNGCKRRSRRNCQYRRQLYDAKYTQAEYKNTLVESRTGKYGGVEHPRRLKLYTCVGELYIDKLKM